MSSTTYDYDNQAWIVDGVYQDCNHPDTMNCKCYGRINKGKRSTPDNIDTRCGCDNPQCICGDDCICDACVRAWLHEEYGI